MTNIVSINDDEWWIINADLRTTKNKKRMMNEM